MEIAPLWGFGCGVATGTVTAVLAAFSGGPLGSGRLAEVGPSAWQAGVIATLEVGVAAAVVAGAVNWLRLRRNPALAGLPDPAPRRERAGAGREAGTAAEDDGHRIFLNPWGSAGGEENGGRSSPGPSELP